MGRSAGKLMPRPRGAYNESETYKILDMVTLDNKLWIATRSGITGITPSKTTPEWMMAVDGTTDVKALETEVDAKFASIDEQFLAKDTQISGLDERVTASESDISALEDRCTTIEGSVKTTEHVIQGSTEPITSGGIYDLFNYKTEFNDADGDYSKFTKQFILGYSGDGYSIRSDSDVRDTLSDGTISNPIVTSMLSFYRGNLTLYSTHSVGSDDTSTVSNETKYAGTQMEFTPYYLEIFASKGDYNNKTEARLRLIPERFAPTSNGAVDLGGSGMSFKDVYATSGTIQTSDFNAKKDISDLSSEQVTSIVMGLRPVSFKFIDGTSDRTHYGLIAQEVESLVNGLGIDNKDFAPLIKTAKVDEDGNVIEGEYTYGLRYSEFTGLLIKMCQNLQNEVDDLKARLGGA